MMKTSSKLVYVPGDYFGKNTANKFHIKDTDSTLIVGCILKKFCMSDNIWYLVYWFLSNEKLWIDANHLTELPINSNIINGKTYINDSNKKFYNIKKNVYYFNNIIINSNHQKNHDENENSKNEYKNINQNQYSSSNSSTINYRFFA